APAPASRSTLAGAGAGVAAGAAKPSNIQYAPGDEVEHKVVGHGVVQKITPVAGDHIVEIKFDTAGVKKTMANYAPLKKL
ncbi:MAG: hypothetical protein ACK5L3_03385, partial [Oscillospiraceae bacterium]